MALSLTRKPLGVLAIIIQNKLSRVINTATVMYLFPGKITKTLLEGFLRILYIQFYQHLNKNYHFTYVWNLSLYHSLPENLIISRLVFLNKQSNLSDKFMFFLSELNNVTWILTVRLYFLNYLLLCSIMFYGGNATICCLFLWVRACRKSFTKHNCIV